MKSVRLQHFKAEELKFTADRVYLGDCEIPFETDITARVVECKSWYQSLHGIKCQELHGREVNQVPSMVQNITLSLRQPPRSMLEQFVKNLNNPAYFANLVVPELRGCNALRSLKIFSGIDCYRLGFPVPSSVEQLIIGNRSWSLKKRPYPRVLEYKSAT